MTETRIRGIYAAIGASLMFAAMGTVIKAAAPNTSNEMVVFLRNGFGLLFLLPALLRHGTDMLATRRFPAHLGRSLFGLAAMYCFFFAIARMHLAEAVLLNFSSPVFTAIIAALWLKESLSLKTASAVLIGLLGVALILKPAPGTWSAPALVGLISAVFAALAMVNIRRMSETEPTLRIVLYFSIISTAVSALPLPWAWQAPSRDVLLAMAAAGMFASLGQLMLTYSYTTAPAARIGTINYSTVIFAALFGWWIWGETPDFNAAVGAILVCIAGILVSQRPPAEAD
ncbi:MAG: DMT family transporter [Chromatiales bacterium]